MLISYKIFGTDYLLCIEGDSKVPFIDLSRFQNSWRLAKYTLKYPRKNRPDMSDEYPERFYWGFVLWIWKFKKCSQAKIMKRMTESQKPFTILRSQKYLDQLLRKRSIQS